MFELICTDSELLKKIENGEFSWDELKSPDTLSNDPLFNDLYFVLLIDGVKVVNYRVNFERINNRATGITSAEIQYENLFAASDNFELKEKYLGKGYVKNGLKLICDYLLKYCNIPYIHAEIGEDNIISQKVASSCGFINGKLYHPNARFLYQKALGDKFSKDQVESFMRSFDIDYEKTLIDDDTKKR